MYKIIKNSLVKKTLIFDGLERDVNKEIVIKLSECNIVIKPFWKNNDILGLKKIMEKTSIDQIINECNLTDKHSLLGIYKNSEKMIVYYFIHDNYLIILSFGEIQYGRYKIYLEGVWELE